MVHVFFVQVKSPIVQHVHQHQPVPPVYPVIIHLDQHVPYVLLRNVPHVIQPVEPVQHVNQVIICQVEVVQPVPVKCHNVLPVPQMEVHVQNVIPIII